MKRNYFPLVGIALYLIVTVVDVFLVSLPMIMYVAALVMGFMLVMSAFAHDIPAPRRAKRTRER